MGVVSSCINDVHGVSSIRFASPPPTWLGATARLVVAGLVALRVALAVGWAGSPPPGPAPDAPAVRADAWGFDPTNATAALQAAIRSGASRVLVPNMGTPWLVDPIFLESNQELEFEPGVVIAARTGSYIEKDACLFSAIHKSNIVLRGSQTVWRMNRADYTQPPYPPGEWRHILALRGCENIQITGLRLENSGGDGIYIGRGLPPDGPVACTDIVIRDVVCDGNYRQGISVISARRLRIEACTLRNTRGTPPQAGIDFEPNLPDEVLEDCVLVNCRFEQNAGFGIMLHLGQFNTHSHPVSIAMEGCRSRNNALGSLYIRGSSLHLPLSVIVLSACELDGHRDVQPSGNLRLLGL